MVFAARVFESAYLGVAGVIVLFAVLMLILSDLLDE